MVSQASKHVDWCMKKAEKEIGECNKLGKRSKHRGLVKKNPNKEEAKNHISRAEENLEFALSLEKGKFGYVAINSLFYCAYHCFLAIASKFGYESGNQTCTIALVEYLNEEGTIALDEKFIEMMKYEDEQESNEYPSVIDMREEYTYGSKIKVPENKLKDVTHLCSSFLNSTKEMVYG